MFTETITADGNSTAVNLNKSNDFASVQCAGDFGGGVVKIQGSLDGTNYSDIEDASYSSAFITNVAFRGFIRINVAGATSPDIDVFIKKYEPFSMHN